MDTNQSVKELGMKMVYSLRRLWLGRHTLGVLGLALAGVCAAAPVADLSAGQVGRIEFVSSNPPHRWALIRGQLGPAQVVYGDLLMPERVVGRVPAVIMSHGSDGVTEGMREIWAKPLLAAGYAVFIVDSFTPRGVDKLSDSKGQLTWETAMNIADAVNALKLLSTHPSIDPRRIFHLGWSRGGNVVTGAMWSNYRLPITHSSSIRWAGSVALYPGCNVRYRNPTLKIDAPVLYLLGGKDDMTPAAACAEEAQLLAAAGNPVSYKIYPSAYHVFDRINQPWKRFREGTYARCAVDAVMPASSAELGWRGGFDRSTGKPLDTAEEWRAALRSCAGTFWITVATDQKARDEAVRDTLAFFNGISAGSAESQAAPPASSNEADVGARAQQIMKDLHFR